MEHHCDAKGNKDRLVPLPQATHHMLQAFWLRHRNRVMSRVAIRNPGDHDKNRFARQRATFAPAIATA